MDGSADTMKMVEVSMHGMRFAVELSIKGLEALAKLVRLIEDQRLVNMGGKVSMKELLKRNPNTKSFHIPKKYEKEFVKECKKYNVPFTVFGNKYNQTDELHFFVSEDCYDRMAAICELLIDKAVKEKVEKEGKTPEQAKVEAKSEIGECDLHDAIEEMTEGKNYNEFVEEFKTRCPEIEASLDKELASCIETLNTENVNKGFDDITHTLGMNKFSKKYDLLKEKEFQHEFKKEDICGFQMFDGVDHVKIKSPNGKAFIWVAQDEIAMKDGKFIAGLDKNSKIICEDLEENRKEMSLGEFKAEMEKSAKKKLSTPQLSEKKPELPKPKTK